MKRLEYVTFRERAAEFEAAVLSSREVSRFCSGPYWLMSAHEALHQASGEDRYLIAEEEGTWLVFAENNPPVFYPLEVAWTFGCPIIGDPERAIKMIRKLVWDEFDYPVGFMVTGVKKEGFLHRELRGLEVDALQYEEFETVDCLSINLEGGVDEWLGRRSRKFRRTIRHSPLPEDVEIEDAHDSTVDDMFRRIMRLQRKTYKWRQKTDIFLGEEYVRFYRDLLRRITPLGNTRLLFAKREGEDLAYILGGVTGDTYRGFQMSYVEKCRNLGIGNALQIESMRRAEAEGIVNYDLGMHAPYKERWADQWDEYLGVFIVLA